jgi:hypothetical protein
MILETGSEIDKRDPIPTAQKWYEWVIAEDKIEKRGRPRKNSG